MATWLGAAQVWPHPLLLHTGCAHVVSCQNEWSVYAPFLPVAKGDVLRDGTSRLGNTGVVIHRPHAATSASRTPLSTPALGRVNTARTAKPERVMLPNQHVLFTSRQFGQLSFAIGS